MLLIKPIFSTWKVRGNRNEKCRLLFIWFFCRSSHSLAVFFQPVFSKLIFFSVIYILTHLMKSQEKSKKQYDKSVFLLALIPLSSVFIMFTFISIGEAFPLSPSLDWMMTAGAVLLLTSNLLMFGMNQYHQKKNEEYLWERYIS